MLIPLVMLLVPFPSPVQDTGSRVTPAGEEEVKAYLARYRDASKSGDARAIAAALAPMTAHDNPEFLRPALDTISYRASSFDKREARREAAELGSTSKKDIDVALLHREAQVQVAAAFVLANYPGEPKALKGLLKAYKDKAVRKSKPKAFAAIITALATLGYDKLEKEMLQLVDQATEEATARAAVRYFGIIRSHNYSALKKLAQMLTAPAPGDVNSASNPPAGYWAGRWEVWNWIRRDVTWSLKQVTGETFRPAEGEHEGDTKRALEFLKANKKKLDLR